MPQFNGCCSAFFHGVLWAVHFKNAPPCLGGIGSTKGPQFIKAPFRMQRHP